MYKVNAGKTLDGQETFKAAKSGLSGLTLPLTNDSDATKERSRVFMSVFFTSMIHKLCQTITYLLKLLMAPPTTYTKPLSTVGV